MNKPFFASGLAIVALFLFTGFVIAETYKPGVYEAQAIGRKGKGRSGLVKVAVTVSGDKIKDIQILAYDQSVDHKQYGAPILEAKEVIPKRILQNNSVDVDVVAKATMSSNGIQVAVAKALEQATIKYKPGVYKAQSLGRKGRGDSGLIEVEVTVSETKIEDIKVLAYEQSVDHKEHGPPVTKAREEIPRRILEKNSIDVDVVAKATMSSAGIQIAVAKALEQARIQ